MEDPRRLSVYKKAKALAREIYAATRTFPRHEWHLASQLNDAVDSISSNIAEGCERKNRRLGNAELIRYCLMGHGSAGEVRDRLEAARDRNLISIADYSRLDGLTEEVKKMLSSFIRRLQDDDRGRT